MPDRANKNQLLVIWVLKKLGWSDRRIARLKLPSSHHTISAYYEKACERIEAKELPIYAKDERRLRIVPSGNSTDLEYLEGKIHHNPCGGGRRVKQHIYNDEFKDVSGEREQGNWRKKLTRPGQPQNKL